MKLAIKVKLLPGGDDAQSLSTTLTVCNQAANLVSAIARERDIRSSYDLRAITYGLVKDTVLGAQASQQVIRKVTDAYKTHRANLFAGHYGKVGTKRRVKAEQKVIGFRPTAAQPYDDRILSWNHEAKTVSIWVVDTGGGVPGRIRVRFTGAADQLELLAAYRQGESDLMVDAQGRWFLMATIDVPGVEVVEPNGWLGVDLGIVNIATIAAEDGTQVGNWSGGAVTVRRRANQKLRTKLQKKNTKSAKRLLAKWAGREARFVTNTNHVVSKKIVAEAKRTGAGIAVEELTGIRDRVRHRKPQRAAFHSWAFAQLGSFLAYKAEAAGVAFVQVDPAYTSQLCSACGQTDKKSRKNQATYRCTTCGVSLNADHNAAINIARRGADSWAVSHAADDAA